MWSSLLQVGVLFASANLPLSVSAAPSSDICTSEACRELGSRVKSWMGNNSVSPCDDFIAYSTGGWIATAEVNEATFDYPEIAVQNVVLEIVDRANVTKPTHKGDKENLHNIGSFWEMCSNMQTRTNAKEEPILAALQDVVDVFRGEKVVDTKSYNKRSQLDDWMKTTPASRKGDRASRLTQALIYLHARGSKALFDMDVGFDSRRHPDQIVPATAQLEFPFVSDDTEDNGEHINRNALLLAWVSKALNLQYKDVEDLGFSVNKLESILNSHRIIGNTNPETDYLKLTFAAASKRTASVDWAAYVTAFSQTRRTPKSFLYSVGQYMDSIDEALTTSEDVIEAYLLLSYMRRYGINAPLKSGLFDIAAEDIKAVDSTFIRRQCLGAAITELPNLLGTYYLRETYTNEIQSFTEKILSDVIKVFRDRLPGIKWLDSKTKKLVDQKAAAIRWLVGYPRVPLETDAEAIHQFFKRQEPFDESHYLNMVRAAMGKQLTTWSWIGRKAQDVFYGSDTLTMNAEYNPQLSKITIYAPIQHDPFLYSIKDTPDYMQMGALGVVSAHEITHGFDSLGRLNDYRGALVNWWTPSSAKIFEEKAQCLIDQFSKYCTSDGTCIDGEMDIGEIAADLGGSNLAYAAWQERRKSGKYENGRLPGVEHLTPEQMFYMAFARVWADKESEENRKIRMLTDVHPPSVYRVIGTLQNNEHFAKTFNCPLGSFMNPVKKCSIW